MLGNIHTFPLRGKQLPELIIHDNSRNFETKFKSQTDFVRKSVVLCPNMYVYHNEMKRDALIREFTEKV